MKLIDSHAHLTFSELRHQVDEVLARAADAGVERIITIGTDLATTRDAVALARRYPDRVHAAGAFHPHEAVKVTECDPEAIAAVWDDPAVVALGEMGLDYHYDFSDRASQQSVFARQLELAASRDKPLIIHCREAFADVVAMLIEHGFRGRPVVFHCFDGTADEASRVADCGWRASFTGVVTFTKSAELRQIAKTYSDQHLMIETDSPYLSPVPVRGKRPNEPAHLVHTARFLADLRGVAYDELVEQIGRNTQAFFKL